MLSSRKIDATATQSVTRKRRSVAAKAGATVTMVVTTVGLFIGAGTMPASAASPAPVSPAVAAMTAQLQAMLPQILAARAQTAAQNQAAAVHAAAAGCAGSFSSVSPVTISGATASINVHVDQALCDPLTLSFVSYTKVDGKPYPMGPQNLFDKDTQTLQATGVYTFKVNVEQSAGGVCASQIDLLKEANPPTHIAGLDLGALLAAFTSGNLLNLIGPIVAIDPVGGDFINGAQLDMPQYAACGATEVSPQNETKPFDPGTSVSGASGELPMTGGGSWPIAIVGLAFLAFGWVLLAARSAKVAAAPARTNRF
jgi:hypothetical protein